MENQIKEVMLQKFPNLEKVPDLRNRYAGTELTEDEREFALYIARKWKTARLTREAYQEKIKSEPKYLNLTIDQMGQFAMGKFSEKKNIEFEIDDQNAQVFNLICQYFSRDKGFEETGGFNLDKGIYLWGGLGVGKTSLMEMFIQNNNQSYAVVKCRNVADQYQNGGWQGKDDYDGISKYSATLKTAIGANPFGHKEIGYCFDDLGTETFPAKHYGQDKNVMAETILNRYDAGIPFSMTHITTNLSFDQVKENYGPRVLDRIIEMFNIIKFPETATSRR